MKKKKIKKLKISQKKKREKLEKKEAIQSLKNKKTFLAARLKIKVIGIGGGGGSIVAELASKIKKAEFWAANTDQRALREIAKRVKSFHFGENLTGGLGTGMSVDLGKTAAEQEKEKIKKLLQGGDFIILIACLGGGTGSGATPVFAKISQNLRNLTYGIFTLPFSFEGEKKMEIAKEALEKLKPYFNAISIIPNERIFQIIEKTTPLKEALSAINKQLAESLESLINIIYQPALINIDFADLKTILKGRGRLTYLSCLEVQGENRLEEALKKITTNPLYPYNFRGAKAILLNIEGEKNLGLFEVEKISKNIQELAHKEARIIFGVSPTKKYPNKIKITLLATGCLAKIFSQKEKKEKKIKKIKKIIQKKPKKEKILKKKKRKKKIKKKKEVKKEKKKEFLSKQKKEIPKIEKEKEEKIRKNALQVKKEIEAQEEELLSQEKIWETPAFLRKQKENSL